MLISKPLCNAFIPNTIIQKKSYSSIISLVFIEAGTEEAPKKIKYP